MMVEERERLAFCHRMQPEGEFRQLHRHRVEVNAVNARFHNAPPPIGEFRLFAPRFGHERRIRVRD